MTTTEILLALGVGLITGFFFRSHCLGGGILLTPMLRLFLDTPKLLALATPLPVLFPTAISSSIAYHPRTTCGLQTCRIHAHRRDTK